MARKKEKIIGVIGGMGPESTIDFLLKIIKNTPARKDQDHLQIIVNHNPKIPDRTNAILKKRKSPVLEIVKTAKKLEKVGVDFFVMPCNTAHYFLPEVEKHLKVPFINIVRETISFINQNYQKVRKVGLLATTGTIHSKLYQEVLNETGIETVVPSNKLQENMVMRAVRDIKAGRQKKSAMKRLIKTVVKLQEQGAQLIISACTEVPLALNQKDVNLPLIDSTEILAKSAVKKALLG